MSDVVVRYEHGWTTPFHSPTRLFPVSSVRKRVDRKDKQRNFSFVLMDSTVLKTSLSEVSRNETSSFPVGFGVPFGTPERLWRGTPFVSGDILSYNSPKLQTLIRHPLNRHNSANLVTNRRHEKVLLFHVSNNNERTILIITEYSNTRRLYFVSIFTKNLYIWPKYFICREFSDPNIRL